jgi:transposase
MGATYAYQTKRTNRVKLVFWEGSGVCLLPKPLAGVETPWIVADEDIRLAPAQLSALFSGIDWGRRQQRIAMSSA